MAKKQTYGNESITSLKGADRVRLRPAVIFGSDGIDGCQHSIFEILSNSIDEARQGFGKEITITRFLDHSVQVEDHGRGLQQQGAALQLGAGVLRDVRRRQVQQRFRGELRVLPGLKRPGPVRHPVRLGVYGRGHPPGWLPLHPPL